MGLVGIEAFGRDEEAKVAALPVSGPKKIHGTPRMKIHQKKKVVPFPPNSLTW